MRVIAGTARGKNLQALPGEDITRPTINRVKEAMFSSVQFLVPGARVLDLFAGSGQLGIEALSRGAKSCLFVDRSAEALAIVKANCKTAGVDRQSDIRQGEAESFLANIRGPFDLALLDPPFHHDTVAAVLPLPIPASVYGLLLLAAALKFGVLKLDQVRETGLFLTGIFPLLFVPAAAGVMELGSQLMNLLLPAVLAIVPITALVMAVTGMVAQKCAGGKEHKNG